MHDAVQYPSAAEIIKFLIYTGLSHGELAEKAGVNRSTIYRIEAEGAQPRSGLARRLEALYDKRKAEFEKFREESRK